MRFLGVVVTERAAHAAHKILLDNREPEVRFRLCSFNTGSIREGFK
jgi:hypothetical protein